MKKKAAPYLNADLYLREDHNAMVKDKDIQLGDILSSCMLGPAANILDVGCATGALLAYLKQHFPGWTMTGIEPDARLVEEAKSANPDLFFDVGTATQLESIWTDTFDAILSTGVFGIFDPEDAQQVLSEMIRCTKKNGVICILANFNDHPADVIVKFAKHHNGLSNEWESGWNIYAEITMRSWLKDMAQSVEFLPFTLTVDQPPKDDPSRSFTFKDENGKRMITNGLRILANLQYCVIRV